MGEYFVFDGSQEIECHVPTFSSLSPFSPVPFSSLLFSSAFSSRSGPQLPSRTWPPHPPIWRALLWSFLLLCYAGPIALFRCECLLPPNFERPYRFPFVFWPRSVRSGRPRIGYRNHTFC